MVDKVNSNVLNISYSTLEDVDIPWNTAELYEFACKAGFDGVKGDVSPTSDSKLIMCHDSLFRFDEDGRVFEPGEGEQWAYSKNISDMTHAQCRALEYNSSVCRDYLGYYAKVADLEDLVRLCSEYSKFPFITLRDREIDVCVDETYRLLVKYNMTRCCMINSFTEETLEKMRAKDSEIYLSYVQDLNMPLTTEAVDTAYRLGRCIVCVFWTVMDPGVFDEMYEKSLHAMKYAEGKGVQIYLAHSYNPQTYKMAVERGFKGFQCLTTNAFVKL